MNKAWRREWWRARREDCAALLVITIFFILFFHPVFFGGRFFVINDAFVYSYPLRMTAWDALRQGQLPLWTPLIMSGYPLLSMSHLGLAYPLTWGYLFLPGHWAEQIYILAPYLLTPMFVYAYARETNRSRMAALLAGLAFGYGGLMVSAVANNGLLPNALMWLPLILVALERARARSFIPCLLAATLFFGMSVLSGVGQGFVYVGAVFMAYALFLVIAANSLNANQDREALAWKSWERWRPLAVAFVAALLSAGLAAFQILETLRAARRSVRSVLTYEIFTEASYTFLLTLKTFLTPLHYIMHATAYVSPLAAALAIAAVVVAVRPSRRDARVFFWLAVAVTAWVLMMGANTPLYRLLYHVPVINSFRAPPRHAFEWSFAIAVLSAYGWDAAAPIFSRARAGLARLPLRRIVLGLLLLAAGVVVSVVWLREANRFPAAWDESNHYPKFPESRYLLWKILLALLTSAIIWLGWRIAAPRWRAALVASAVALSCFAEPAVLASRWWWPALKTAERFTVASPATLFMQAHQPEQQRLYTRAVLWTEEMLEQPRVDAANLTMLHGLRNTGGYEPLIMERYSRALGNVSMDATNPRLGFKPERTIFEPHSHVLDILNTAYVVSYFDLLPEPTPLQEKEGIRFQALDINREIKPGETTEIAGVAHEADTLAIVSAMSNSGEEADDQAVVHLRIFTRDGRVIERDLRAGADTAEWAHERADVKAAGIRHRLAPVFDSHPGDEENSFPSYHYWTRIALGERAEVTGIELTNVSRRASFGITKMTLYDSTTKLSLPLPHYDLDRWELAYERDGVQMIRNKRVLPRAWLVAEAVAVDGEEALRRIRGESETEFDPGRTALLEVSPAELPSLPGGAISSEAVASIVAAEPNRMVIETSAQTPTVLIVSEANYPGWVATVDGRAAAIHSADFLLRGVSLPAGAHRVEMRYTAPGARAGLFITLATILLIIGLVAYYRGKDTRLFRAAAGRASRAAKAIRVVLSMMRREGTRLLRVMERPLRRAAESRRASLPLCFVFALLMIFNCVFPLNAVWTKNGIVEPDCAQAMWNLWAVNEAITSGQNPYATRLLYYPIGAPNLSHQAIAAGFFPVTLLVKTLTRASPLYPLYAYRLITWLCFALLLYSSYWLLRELGFSLWAAGICAVAYSFSDFFMEHVAHINILAGFFIPLAALSIVRFYREPESTVRAASAAVVLAAAVYFTETTLYIYLGLLLFVILMSLRGRERRLLAGKLVQAGWRRMLPASIIFVLLIAPYLLLLLTDDSLKPPLSEHLTYSANLAGFFIPHPQRTPLYGELFATLGARVTKGVGGYEVFACFVLLVFALIGVLTTKERLVRLASVAALVFYVLSLGPTLKIFETDTGFKMPYAFLMRLPPFDWGRTPSRFVVIGMFFVMIVAAGGLSWTGRVVMRRLNRGASVTLMSLLALWTIAEAYSPTPRQQVFVPPLFPEKSVAGPVLNLPVFKEDGYAMLLQLFHRQPIATGYLARVSTKRQQHVVELRGLFDKGGAGLCEQAARIGIKTIIIAPEAYIADVAPDMGPINLGQCALNVIDLRGSGGPPGEQADTSQFARSEQPRNYPLFAAGATLNFNSVEAIPFLWYGWSGIEPYSRWSSKGTAAVVFSVETVARDRLLLVRMSPFLAPGKLDAQRVRVGINGKIIETLTLTDDEPKLYRVVVPRAALGEKNILTFELPDAASPASLNLSDEERLLGINVQWIKLDFADAQATGAGE
jgi:hypothetical protein